jgi:hypothetical protein
MPKPPALFTRCEDDNAFLKPVTGSALAKTGTPTYAAGRFGNGVEGVNNAYWLCSPDNIFASGNNQAGAIRFWWKPAAGFDAVNNALFYFSNNVSNTPGVYTYIVGSGAIMRTSVQVISGVQNTIDLATNTFVAGTQYHMAVVWDMAGIGGGADVARVYKDGVDVGSSGNACPVRLWPANCGSLGNYYHIPAGNQVRGIIDNFKIYDYAKTDFNDRFNERGGMNDQVMAV